MSQEQRVQRSSGVLVTDLILPPMWRVVFAAELNLRDRAGARIHEVLAACRCWQQGELLWKDPLVDVPEAEAVFLHPVDWPLGSCMLPLRHPRFLCRMPASVAHSWRSGQPQVHAGGAGRAPPDWSAWSARAPVTPEGGREPRLLCFYKLGDGRQQVATLCYKPGPSARCSSGSGLPGTVSPSRTPGRAGVQEQSFCRVRGSSQGCHVSVGLQLWAVGLALVIMPGDLGVYAAESLSAASAPESAYTALGEMSRQRAGQWREQHGFLNDADFAYAFRSYEDAMAQAGTPAAEEWAVVRSIVIPQGCVAQWLLPWMQRNQRRGTLHRSGPRLS